MPGIVIQITGDGAGAAEALRVIEERMQQTARKGNEMGDQLAKAGERIRSAMEMIGIGIGIHQVVDGLKEMITKSMELGVELSHMSQQTGIGVENLSVLKFMSDQTGVSFESLSKGFKKLSTELVGVQHGTKASIEAFKDAGISQTELTATGGDLYKVMGLVADKFQQMPDGYQKNAAATALFGRAGQQLIPVLNQGAAGIEGFKAQAEALGVVLDEKGVQKMEDLHKSVISLKAAFSGLGLTLTSEFAGPLTTLSNFISNNFGAGLQAMDDWLLKLATIEAKLGVVSAQNLLADHNKALWQNSAWSKAGAGVSPFGSPPPSEQQPPPNPPPGAGAAADQMEVTPWWVTNLQYRMGVIQKNLADTKKDAAELDKIMADKAWESMQSAQTAGLADLFKSKAPNVANGSSDIGNATEGNPDSQFKTDAALESARTISGFMDGLSSQALRGKADFKSLVDSAIMDLERWGMKIMEEKAIIPALNALFGVGAGGSAASYAPGDYAQTLGATNLPMLASGGDLSGGDMAIVGDGKNGDMSNAEIWAPGGPGTVLPHDVLAGIAKGGGGGGTPNVQINTINNSSQPVQQSQASVSYDAQARQFIIHTILEDMQQGGAMSTALGSR